MYLHALPKNLPIRVFQVAAMYFKLPPCISVPYVKVGSTKALNRWDLNSQHVTMITDSFLKVSIKAFILAILHFLLGG